MTRNFGFALAISYLDVLQLLLMCDLRNVGRDDGSRSQAHLKFQVLKCSCWQPEEADTKTAHKR